MTKEEEMMQDLRTRLKETMKKAEDEMSVDELAHVELLSMYLNDTMTQFMRDHALCVDKSRWFVVSDAAIDMLKTGVACFIEYQQRNSNSNPNSNPNPNPNPKRSRGDC